MEYAKENRSKKDKKYILWHLAASMHAVATLSTRESASAMIMMIAVV